MMVFQSIKSRLIFNLLAGFLLIYIISGVIFYQVTKKSLTAQFDDALITWVNNTSEMFDFEEVQTDEEFENTVFDDQYRMDDKKYYQVWTDNGKTVSKSLSMEDVVLPFKNVRPEYYRFQDILLPGGTKGRCAWFSYINHRMDESPVTGIPFYKSSNRLIIGLAHSRDALDGVLSVILICMICVGVALIAGSGLIIRFSITSGLTPLADIARKTSMINSEDLSQRFMDDGMPEELRPITERLNDMLVRLETAFLREKRFTANVAHELRTPIAELRALADVGLTDDLTSDADIRTYFEDALSIAVQMQNMTEALLMLARIDAGTMAVTRDEIVVDDLLKKIISRLNYEKGDRAITIVFEKPVIIVSDRTLIAAVLTNIIANALSYSPDETPIELILSEDGAGCLLSCTNKMSPPLYNKDLGHMFEPFWRKDDARSDLSHSGIGLAIVKSCCQLLGISIEVSIPSSKSFNISLFVKS